MGAKCDAMTERPQALHEKAIQELQALQRISGGDIENDHVVADKILCDLLTSLGYADVVAEYHKIEKWYA